jgi:hypothetical protein
LFREPKASQLIRELMIHQGIFRSKGTKTLIHLLFVAALAGQAATTPEPAPPTSVVAQAPPAKPEKPKLICVKQEVMGSLFPNRICATEEEWKARRQRETDRMDRMRERTGTCTQC